MFAPIQNGTIFDMILAVTIGIIFGVCINMAYYRALLDMGYDPTEHRVWLHLVRDLAGKSKNIRKGNRQ